jgi:hypothetical protein
VRIASPLLSPDNVEYAFTMERVARLAPEPAHLPETLARIAIHQVHKQYLAHGKRDLFLPGRELAVDTSPWLGDLEPVAYGGATTGWDQRSR